MLRTVLLFLALMAQAIASDSIHVTGPGIHHYTLDRDSYDIQYARLGHTQPGCVDQCDMFGCNHGALANPMCEPVGSIALPVYSHTNHYSIELEVLAAPAGMVLDETFDTTNLSFKGSKQFAFRKTSVDLGNMKRKITLQPMKLKTVRESVTLDKHVYLKNGILTYWTKTSAVVKIDHRLILKRSGTIFRREVNHWLNENDLAPHRVSEVVPTGVKHTVDLHKVLKQKLAKGKWVMSLDTSFNSTGGEVLVEREFQDQLKSSLYYTIRAR